MDARCTVVYVVRHSAGPVSAKLVTATYRRHARRLAGATADTATRHARGALRALYNRQGGLLCFTCAVGAITEAHLLALHPFRPRHRQATAAEARAAIRCQRRSTVDPAVPPPLAAVTARQSGAAMAHPHGARAMALIGRPLLVNGVVHLVAEVTRGAPAPSARAGTALTAWVLDADLVLDQDRTIPQQCTAMGMVAAEAAADAFQAGDAANAAPAPPAECEYYGLIARLQARQCVWDVDVHPAAARRRAAYVGRNGRHGSNQHGNWVPGARVPPHAPEADLPQLHDAAVEKYWHALIVDADMIQGAITLRGRDVMCHCTGRAGPDGRPLSCHGRAIVAVANATPAEMD